MIHSWRMEGSIRAYHEGELTGAAGLALELHFAGCAACRQRLGSLREIDALLMGSRPAPGTLAAEDTRLMLARVLVESGATPRRRTWGGAWSIVAAMAIAAVGTAGIHAYTASPGGAREPAPMVRLRPVELYEELVPDARLLWEHKVVPDRPIAPRCVTHHRSRRRARRSRAPFVLASISLPQGERTGTTVLSKEGVDLEFAMSGSLPPGWVGGASAAAYWSMTANTARPAGRLLLAVRDARDLDLKVREAAEETPGFASASSSLREADGRVTSTSVRVSSEDTEPEIVLTGTQSP